MQKQMLLAMLIFSIAANSYAAGTSYDLKAGQAAPVDGVLLDKVKANEVKNELLEKDGLVKLNQSLTLSLELMDKNQSILTQKTDLLLAQNTDLIKANNDSRSTSTWAAIGYTLLGVGIAGLGVWGASKLAR